MLTINPKDERLIRIFCKTIRNSLKEPRRIRNEVEEELYENIKANALSFISESITSSMAVKLAIDEYESPKSVLKELSETYKVKKTFNNKIIGLSILLLLISAVTLSVFYYWNNYLVEKDLARATLGIPLLAEKQTGNESTLPYIVTENPTIEAAWTTITNEENKDGVTYVFPENLNLDLNTFERTENIFYRTVFHSYVSSNSNKKFKIDTSIAQIHLKSTFFFIGAFILLVSFSLFVYWLIYNVKHRVR